MNAAATNSANSANHNLHNAQAHAHDEDTVLANAQALLARATAQLKALQRRITTLDATVAADTASLARWEGELSTDRGRLAAYLRQQYVDRNACQLADPEIACDVLDNPERLQKAETLLELAAELAQGGHVSEALQRCAHAQTLFTGSPCASRSSTTCTE